MTGNYQAGPSGGEASPIYNLLASSLLSKYSGPNTTTGNPGPLTCTCGFCNQRALPPGPPRPSSVLSGVVVFPSSELQQVLRAPVPVPLYAPSPHTPHNPQLPSYTPPSPQSNTPSYIMSIPRKYSQEPPPQKTQQETFYPPQNPDYPSPPSPPTSAPPHPYYYTPKSPLMASCPATFYFPPTQATSFNHPYVYPSSPPPQTNPSLSPFPSSPNSYPPYLGRPSPPPASSNPPAGSKEPLVTYTLRATNDISPGTSLEAESKDCSMPNPPVIV